MKSGLQIRLNQPLKLADINREKRIPVLAWKIATQPAIYRALSANPYSFKAVQTGIEKFPDAGISDVIRATVFAEPEGSYDRNFKLLTEEEQQAELEKQNVRIAQITALLNNYYSQYTPGFWEFSEELTYHRLSKIAFEATDSKEIEQRFSRYQRKELKLLIVAFIEKLEAEIFMADIPKLKFFEVNTGRPRAFQIRPTVFFSKQAFLTVYAGAALIFIFVPAYGLIMQKTGQTQIAGSVSGHEIEQLAGGLPVRLQIPGLGIDANVEHLGVNPEGEMEVPADVASVGWFKFGPSPGKIGSAVISGHIDGRKNKAGVFDNLDKLQPGDKIEVTDRAGVKVIFVVRESRTYEPGYAEEVFSANDNGRYLNLVTCEGKWDKATKSYPKRLVVFADLQG